MKIKPICESKQSGSSPGIEGKFYFQQNSQVHCFLINLVLLWNLVLLFLWVKILTLLVAWLEQLLEVRCLGVSTPQIPILVEVATTNFWCVLCRGPPWRTEVQSRVSRHCSVNWDTHPLGSVAPSEDDGNGPRSDAGPQLSDLLAEGFLVMVQLLLRHIFSRIISRHFAKFNYSGTTILVATEWFHDSSKNFLLSLFDPGFRCWILPLIHGLRDSITDQEYLSIPLNSTGFQPQWGFAFLDVLALRLPFLTCHQHQTSWLGVSSPQYPASQFFTCHLER